MDLFRWTLHIVCKFCKHQKIVVPFDVVVVVFSRMASKLCMEGKGGFTSRDQVNWRGFKDKFTVACK